MSTKTARAKTVRLLSRCELLDLGPTTDVVTAGRAYGIGRNSVYELVRRNEFPVRVLKLGNKYRVATDELLRDLGIERGDGAPAA